MAVVALRVHYCRSTCSLKIAERLRAIRFVAGGDESSLGAWSALARQNVYGQSRFEPESPVVVSSFGQTASKTHADVCW